MVGLLGNGDHRHLAAIKSFENLLSITPHKISE